MTKIDQINETMTIPAMKKPNISTSVHFSASLEDALYKKISNNNDRGQTAALCEPQSSMINQSGVVSTDVVEQTDKLLGLLETYAKGLENPKASLKELASIVTLMKDEAKQLMASTDNQAGGENDVNGIAAKAALTANVEYIKFQRGDYI